MTWRLAMLLCGLLAALVGCASPGPEFFGSTRRDIRLGGIDFVVFRKGDRVEVIRMGYLRRAERAEVPALMQRAAEVTSGCRVVPGSAVTRLPGDTGEARMVLRC